MGDNGTGKSTLLRTIIGEIEALGGYKMFGHQIEIGYFDQNQANFTSSNTVLEEIWNDNPDLDMQKIRSVLGAFLFTADEVFKEVRVLSGGEKARLELTKLSFKPINFLVLDEPTNHLDIDSREVLENAINEFNGTVLFISHDRYFINQVATDVLDMHADGIKHYEGNYDDYLAAVNKVTTTEDSDTQAASKPSAKRSDAQQSYQQSKETQRARRKLQRQVDKLESQMTELEEQEQAIQEKMSQPEIATDIGKLSDLQKELDKLNAQSEEVELDWTTAAEELEKFDQENS